MPEFLFTYTDLNVDPESVVADVVEVLDGQYTAYRDDAAVARIRVAGVRSVVRQADTEGNRKLAQLQEGLHKFRHVLDARPGREITTDFMRAVLDDLVEDAGEPCSAEEAEEQLRLAQQARRAKEHQLDDVRRALCDVGMMQDGDPYSHADLADVIRQSSARLAPTFARLLRKHREAMARADAAVAEASGSPIAAEAWHA